MGKVEVLVGDITTLAVDAIVNAANETLLGGGGVDGAIHRAAGIELLEECKLLSGCLTGNAKVTRGYKLPARFVIHTVGPVWQNGRSGEETLLASCYRQCFVRAREIGAKSLAFPAISCGTFNYPISEAAEIAVSQILAEIRKDPEIKLVYCVCFEPKIANEYLSVLRRNGEKDAQSSIDQCFLGRAQ